MQTDAEIALKTPLKKTISIQKTALNNKKRERVYKPADTRFIQKYVGWILPISILILWTAATNLNWIKPYFVPRPNTIYDRFIEMIEKERFLNDFWLTFWVMLTGYGIGVILGVTTGITAGLSKTFDRAVSPTIHVIRQIPPIAWVPLFVLFLGIATLMKLAFLAKVVAITIFLNTFQGIRNVGKEYLEVGQIFEYSKWQTLVRIVLPAAFPSIFVGLRFALGLSWGYIVFVEMLNGRNGIGWVLGDAMELMDTSRMYVTILVIGFVGFLFDTILGQIEKKLMIWKRQAL